MRVYCVGGGRAKSNSDASGQRIESARTKVHVFTRQHPRNRVALISDLRSTSPFSTPQVVLGMSRLSGR